MRNLNSRSRARAAVSHIHLNITRATPGASRVAVLGTGKMGAAIAARLDESGFEVVLWNRTRSRAEALGLGVIADTPAAAAAGVDIVISSLTGREAVLATYLGPDGALSAGAGKHFIEMSTAGPDLVADLAPQVAAAGGTFVDAPILGAPPTVRAGIASVVVGGASADVADVRQLLNVLGTVRHVGPVGSAARLKLVANSMLADVLLAAAELQAAGEAAGLDRDDVFFVLERVAPSLGARRAGLEGQLTPTWFALRDLRKDMDLAMALYQLAESRTPMTTWSRDQVGTAAAVTPDRDISAIAALYRTRAPDSDPAVGSLSLGREYGATTGAGAVAP
jgi:3-hydroxyisobutyrate dehydrogenase-like beta-hydroxyacid dehydrogenase